MAPSVHEEVLEDLRRLGLTLYESRAYIALLRRGVMTSTEIAKEARIPQPRVYDVLKSLENMGLIYHVEGRPRLFAAEDPKRGLENLLLQARERLEKAYSSLEPKLSIIYQSGSEAAKGREQTIIKRLESQGSIIRSMASAIKSADHEILVSVYRHVYRLIREALIQSASRGVSVSLISYERMPPARELDEHRLKQTKGIVILVADKKELVLATNWYSPDMEPTGYATSNEDLVRLFSEYYLHNLRDLSKPVYSAYGDAVLNRRFVHLPRAISMIEALRDKGLSVEVRVSGRLVKSGSHIEIRGSPASVEYDVYKGIARIIVDAGEGVYSVGGWGATLEDVEAQLIEVYGREAKD